MCVYYPMDGWVSSGGLTTDVRSLLRSCAYLSSMTTPRGFSFIIRTLVSSPRTTVGSDGDTNVVLAACNGKPYCVTKYLGTHAHD